MSCAGEVRRSLSVLCEGTLTMNGRVFLADANLLAIRRLLSRSKSTSYSTITPGPPLSTSHPSPSLLAKLNINVYTLYDESHSLLRRSPSSPLKSSSTAPFIPEIIKYISMGRTISLALSYKWLGIDKGENGGREGCGEAICWLGMSESELKEVEGGGKGVMGIGKAKGKGGKVNEELESVRAFISGYKKVNDTVRTLSLREPSSRRNLTDENEKIGPFPNHPSPLNLNVPNPNRSSRPPSQILPPTTTSVHRQDFRRSDAIFTNG